MLIAANSLVRSSLEEEVEPQLCRSASGVMGEGRSDGEGEDSDR